MMKTMKRIISVFLTVVLVAGLCIWMPVMSFAADENIAAEQVGTYSESGVSQDIIIRITISGVSEAYCGFYVDDGISLPEGWSLKEYTTSNTAQAVASSDYNSKNGKLNYATNDLGDSIPANTYYDAVVTAPANASGSYHITFNGVYCSKTYGTITLVSADSVTAEVKIEGTTYPSEAYSITVSADQTEVEVEDTVKISLNVTNSSADAFNAFYGTLYYDSEAFSFTSASSRASGFAVDDSAYGKLEISRAGSDVSIPGSGPELTLTFTAEAAADSASFILRNARVDMADKANGDAAAAAVSGMPSVKVTDEESGDKIHVTMRLIGAELAEKDVDLGSVKYLPDYVTWIPTTKYELDKDSTVYDLWIMATEDAGIRSVGANKNYVSTVYAPDSLGGYALSEFTNGRRSGWMYTIDGKHPGYGLKEQKLEDGDVVIWHYVNDYSYEVDDWFSEGQWQALGDGTYYNRWLLAPDRFGGKGGGVSEDDEEEEQEEDETDDENEDEDTDSEQIKGETVTVIADVEDGEAKAAVEEDDVTDALENSKDDTLTVIVTSDEEADSVELELTAEAVKAVSDADTNLHIKTEHGTVKLDTETLTELADSGEAVTVTVKANEDGTTKLDVAVGGKPAEVTMKVELPSIEDGEVLVIVQEDGTEEIVKKSLVEDGKVYAELPAGTTVRIIENSKDFEDVKESDWFSDAVAFASSHELFVGVSETEFAPKQPMTRAMLVTVLFRLEDEPDTATLIDFNDVNDDTWFTDAVEWAAAEGIVNGVGDGLFAPNDNVTREQIATMLYRYVQYLGYDVSDRKSLDTFYDGDQVSDWAKEAMQWAVKIGLFQGDDTGSLNPKNNATRAEVATLMQRLVAFLVK